MNRFAAIGVIVLLLVGCSVAAEAPDPESGADVPEPPAAPELGDGWVTLFDGKTLDGWKAAESPESFSVQNGVLIAAGRRGHLFYDGKVGEHAFKNFEFRADVMTTPNSNSGIYFHTKFQETGWPSQGYEVQVNSSHSDWKRTGSLYDVENIRESASKDNVWFTEEIIVRGKQILIKVDGKTLVDYTEPDNPERPRGWENRRLSSGTFAIQGHDPNSKVYFANIMVKPLPDDAEPLADEGEDEDDDGNGDADDEDDGEEDDEEDDDQDDDGTEDDDQDGEDDAE